MIRNPQGPIRTPRSTLGPVHLDIVLLLGIAAIYAVLALQHARASSATFDEVSHLPSGFTYRVLGDYRLNPEHPPFLKALAAWSLDPARVWPLHRPRDLASGGVEDSVAFARISQAWGEGRSDIGAQWRFGRSQLYGTTDATYHASGVPRGGVLPTDRRFEANAFLNDAQELLVRARLASIALGMVLLGLIFSWASALAGRSAAIIATTLAALDPNLIAHGSLVTTDMGLTTFLFGAAFAAWRIMRQPTRLALAGLVLCITLAALSKFSAILLAPILGALGALWIIAPRVETTVIPHDRRSKIRWVLAIAVVSSLTAYGATWAAYGFRFHAVAAADERLPDATARGDFHRMLVAERILRQSDTVSLGWTNHLLMGAYRHQLLPEALLRGVAFARMMAVRRQSYFMGQTSTRGSPLFFPASFLAKTPDVTLVAIGLALLLACWRRSLHWFDVACLMIPPAFILGSAMGSSLNLGYRHILPALPFLLVLTSGLAFEWQRWDRRKRVALAMVTLPVAIISTQTVRSEGTLHPVTPHFLAYFNWMSGGPDQGHQRFVDSNLDWGQGLPALHDWLTVHGETRPIHLCYFGMADPRAHGIAYHPLPDCAGPGESPATPWIPAVSGRPVTIPDLEEGQVVAVSATTLVGLYRSPDQHATLQTFLRRRTTPIGTAGYAIHLFRVTDASP